VVSNPRLLPGTATLAGWRNIDQIGAAVAGISLVARFYLQSPAGRRLCAPGDVALPLRRSLLCGDVALLLRLLLFFLLPIHFLPFAFVPIPFHLPFHFLPFLLYFLPVPFLLLLFHLFLLSLTLLSLLLLLPLPLPLLVAALLALQPFRLYQLHRPAQPRRRSLECVNLLHPRSPLCRNGPVLGPPSGPLRPLDAIGIKREHHVRRERGPRFRGPPEPHHANHVRSRMAQHPRRPPGKVALLGPDERSRVKRGRGRGGRAAETGQLDRDPCPLILGRIRQPGALHALERGLYF
jgi:hypothetical protein